MSQLELLRVSYHVTSFNSEHKSGLYHYLHFTKEETEMADLHVPAFSAMLLLGSLVEWSETNGGMFRWSFLWPRGDKKRFSTWSLKVKCVYSPFPSGQNIEGGASPSRLENLVGTLILSRGSWGQPSHERHAENQQDGHWGKETTELKALSPLLTTSSHVEESSVIPFTSKDWDIHPTFHSHGYHEDKAPKGSDISEDGWRENTALLLAWFCDQAQMETAIVWMCVPPKLTEKL